MINYQDCHIVAHFELEKNSFIFMFALNTLLYKICLVHGHANTVTCDNHCQQAYNCIQNGSWIQCLCKPGYKYDENRICVNINECEQTPLVCSQQCNDIKGSYVCKCVNGYEHSKFGDCKAVG